MATDLLADRLKLKPEYLKELLDIIRAIIPGVEVSVFGSRAKNGEVWEASDIDLLLKDADNGEVDVTHWFDFLQALSDSGIPHVIDVLDWHSLSDIWKGEISKAYVVIHPAEAAE